MCISATDQRFSVASVCNLETMISVYDRHLHRHIFPTTYNDYHELHAIVPSAFTVISFGFLLSIRCSVLLHFSLGRIFVRYCIDTLEEEDGGDGRSSVDGLVV